MKQVSKIFLVFFNLFFLCFTFGQNTEANTSKGGWFSLGARSTLSAFSHEGAGIGTGGQFRIQLADQINTEWFADYITINIEDKVRSDYYHIGWSVMFYPFKNAKIVQPYIVAGHCFDYNKVTLINSPSISVDRWGSAVQAGLATHFNLTERFDITLVSQYMIHLSTVFETHIEPNNISITEGSSTTLHGHLLTTLSLNYKIGKLWNR